MFEIDLYRRLSAAPGNLFFSPYSIGAALALVHAGANGATKKELETALGHADPVETYGALGRELASRSQPTAREKSHLEWLKDAPPDTFGCHLSVANAMWRQTGTAVKPEFLETLRSRLGAGTVVLGAECLQAYRSLRLTLLYVCQQRFVVCENLLRGKLGSGAKIIPIQAADKLHGSIMPKELCCDLICNSRAHRPSRDSIWTGRLYGANHTHHPRSHRLNGS